MNPTIFYCLSLCRQENWKTRHRWSGWNRENRQLKRTVFIAWRMPARLPLPSWLSPRTVRSYSVLCFYFFSRRRKEKTTTNTTYVYTWICLLSDECFVSLWYIPHFTLCTPLNKVYEFIAVYRGAVKAAVVDSVTEHTWSEKHFLVLPVVVAWYKLFCKETHKKS